MFQDLLLLQNTIVSVVHSRDKGNLTYLEYKYKLAIHAVMTSICLTFHRNTEPRMRHHKLQSKSRILKQEFSKHSKHLQRVFHSDQPYSIQPRATMPRQDGSQFSRQITDIHSFQIHIHAPQPVDAAAMHRLQAILELEDNYLANDSTGTGEAAYQSDTLSPDLLAIGDSAMPFHGVNGSHHLPQCPLNPQFTTISQDNTNVDKPQMPEEVIYWPVLKRYLDDPSLACPEPRCVICLETMHVLSLDQAAADDPGSDFERCRVLLCGHLIGSRCFDEYISKRSESMQDQQDEQQEFESIAAPCPICKTDLGCPRCGRLYESALIPAFIEDEFPDVPSILKWPAKPLGICEDCLVELQLVYELVLLRYGERLRAETNRFT